MKTYTAEWLALPTAYVHAVAEHLRLTGTGVVDWWNDPADPRDATILLSGGTAAVWDEESGWRHGTFRSGRPGTRTTLAGVRYLADGLLPDPARAAKLLAARDGVTAGPVYRSFRDYDDGLDERLAAFTEAVPIR